MYNSIQSKAVVSNFYSMPPLEIFKTLTPPFYKWKKLITFLTWKSLSSEVSKKFASHKTITEMTSEMFFGLILYYAN